MANAGYGSWYAMGECRSNFSPCAMTSTTMSGNALADLELHMKPGLAATYDAQQQAIGCYYSAWPASDTIPQAAHHTVFDNSGNTHAQYPHDYQSLLAGLPLRNIASNQMAPVAMTSFPGDEMLFNQRPGSRSSKLKEKIRQLHPFYSRRLTSAAPLEGRTRTRDKYRVVYTEKQRLGLEKAYKEDKFITLAKKTELSKTMALSDRQIKIWFQNRRAKERRDKKKRSPDTDVGSIENDTTSGVSHMQRKNPSCRFEDNENVVPCDQPYTLRYPSLQMAAEHPSNPISSRHQHGGNTYHQSAGSASVLIGCAISDSLMAQPIRKLASPEVGYKYQDCTHARSQMTPSDWMGADVSLDTPPMNLSPFSSSLSVNLSYRT